jgi:hypothetical protein
VFVTNQEHPYARFGWALLIKHLNLMGAAAAREPHHED